MELKNAVAVLGALAHDTRLAIFRFLVQHGPEGVAVGDIASALQLPGATLSFHLNNLKHADLVQVSRHGRSLRYQPCFDTVAALAAYLLEDCCGGQVCMGQENVCQTKPQE